MSKLSKEQIKTLSAETYLYSGLQLRCDSHEIKLSEYRNKNSIRVAMYVDGWVKGIWLKEDADHPESKFYPFMKIRVKENVLKPKCKKMKIVTLKNREIDFANIGQALRHLNKVCDSVEVIEGDDQ